MAAQEETSRNNEENRAEKIVTQKFGGYKLNTYLCTRIFKMQ